MTQQALSAPNRWFEERRHLFLKNMFKRFYETYTRFLDVYTHYNEAGEISFEELEGLVGSESDKGLLWTLKDRCHQLWLNADPQDEMDGCLLDWILGSVFHEAMKLKENIYIYQVYGPLAESMKKNNSHSAVKFCGEECQRFMERTRREIERQMDNLGLMFGRANLLTRTIVREQGANPLLVRYLIENRGMVEELWSEDLDTLLAEMFPPGPEYGYCAAARSYFEGNWYRQAREAYHAALAINPDIDEARQKICQLRALPMVDLQEG